jgi:hypothetical protein
MLQKRRLVIISVWVVFGLILAACGGEAPVSPAQEQPTAAADQPTAAADQPTAAAPLNGAGAGFKPADNGFSYANYGDTGVTPAGEQFPVINLTSVEVRRLLGDGVCAAPAQSDGTCALIPPAEQFMKQINASMQGGHCEGFAVLSQLIYAGVVDPTKFGGARAADLQIKDNQPLQRELAYWFATQFAIQGAQQTLAPADAIKFLQAEYAKDPKNLFRVGIFKADKTGGHAITAYDVKDQGNGVFWIMVYDNNYPGQERHMVVDVNANTWEYEASINPSVQPDVYKGDAGNPMMFAPNQARLQQFKCDFCNATAASRAGGGVLASAAPSYNQIWTQGYVNVDLNDDKGRRIGYDEKGNFVNEIPEARFEPVMAGPLSEVPPVIKMPVGLGFTADIYGDPKAADEPAAVMMIGQGFYLGVDGIKMAPDQLDKLTFDGQGDSLTYTTDSQESPDITIGIEKPEADFELGLKAVQASKGTDIHVLFDQKEEVFAFQTTSDAPAQFSVTLTRIDTNGQETSFDIGDNLITVDPGKLAYVYFGKWKGQGGDLEVGYDQNSNGSIEDSEITNLKDTQ